MPRRQFVEDLDAACKGTSVAGISKVEKGEDVGEFSFHCAVADTSVQLIVQLPEVFDYPTEHMCFISAADNVPAAIAESLADIAEGATGKTIRQMLEHVSQCLQSKDEDGNMEMPDSQDYHGFEDSDEEAEDFFPDDEATSVPFAPRLSSGPGPSCTQSSLHFRQTIRWDLMEAKSNGFKVGCLGGLLDGLACYVTLSCRISKLGISEEAMQAWNILPSEYLVLILSYPNGYRDMASVRESRTNAETSFEMRIGISTAYKPTLQEAIRAFTDLSKEKDKHSHKKNEKESQDAQQTPHRGFRDAFISRPLNGLFKERFVQLLKYRDRYMPWHGTELLYIANIGRSVHSDPGLAKEYRMSDQKGTAWPRIVVNDHMMESDGPYSLPLVSMQFALRHFVRCTEFCLVCFKKMPDDLQAIKPYVCEDTFCLWQYMSLGFGPSIEHEILTQPKVADLLISFCYSSARNGRLQDFPNGLGLMVPPPGTFEYNYKTIGTPIDRWRGTQPEAQTQSKRAQKVANEAADCIHMRYNAFTEEILFDDKSQPCPVRTGDWLIVRIRDSEKPFHCRVTNTSLYPTVSVSVPIISEPAPNPPAPLAVQQFTAAATAAPTDPVNEFQAAHFYKYNWNFDMMNDIEKRQAITFLLDLLPGVSEMCQFLERRAHTELSSWIDRFPPAALGILRWIIASNRACIIQVAEGDGAERQDRLWGMPGWTQFRFAMGAPDKERRFIDAVKNTTKRLNLKYPSLFAWHGSQLHNWHSIIREGLHFKETLNGRAYGHGVYHSLHCMTSMGYSGVYGNSASPVSNYWPRSELKVSGAIALNEIVNVPIEFVSRNPHLVVAQLDWIQTRYLFVQGGDNVARNINGSVPIEKPPSDPLDQDPNYTPAGPADKLIIPKSAVGGSRALKSRSIMKTRSKASGSSRYDPIEIDDDDNLSDATLQEDLDIFREEGGQNSPEPTVDLTGVMTPGSDKGKATTIKTGLLKMFKGKAAVSMTPQSTPLTVHKPSALDYSTLPMLVAPVWATPSATNSLMKAFRDLVKVQQEKPQHELGWYINPDNVENVYQWIVELHSFEPQLPLAQDMEQLGHTSIVLELRFGQDFPMSPPFVRVIRPRFLGFQQGGGGHVTAGGAMCMELLTNTSWRPICSIESVLISVRMALSSLDPKPARLAKGYNNQDYGVGEAVEAYIRACNMHRWAIPPGFKEMAYGGQPSSAQY